MDQTYLVALKLPSRAVQHVIAVDNSRGTSGFFQRGRRTGGAVSAGDRPELERAAALIYVTMAALFTSNPRLFRQLPHILRLVLQ
jgi:hypothetical protein